MEQNPRSAVWKTHSWGYLKVLWAQKGKGVTPTVWSEAGCSWKIELLGGEPSEKAWGGCRESVVIDVHHADPLNLKRWNRAKSK